MSDEGAQEARGVAQFPMRHTMRDGSNPAPTDAMWSPTDGTRPSLLGQGTNVGVELGHVPAAAAWRPTFPMPAMRDATTHYVEDLDPHADGGGLE